MLVRELLIAATKDGTKNRMGVMRLKMLNDANAEYGYSNIKETNALNVTGTLTLNGSAYTDFAIVASDNYSNYHVKDAISSSSYGWRNSSANPQSYIRMTFDRPVPIKNISFAVPNINSWASVGIRTYSIVINGSSEYSIAFDSADTTKSVVLRSVLIKRDGRYYYRKGETKVYT